MAMTELLLEEFRQEIKMTQKVLSRIPENKLTWRPHPKSMSLGQLGLHIALIPGDLAEFFNELTREIPTVPLPEASSVEEILSTLSKSETTVINKFSDWGETGLEADWKMVDGEKILISAPRIMMVRSTLLNHWYHHRGQLTVYLRLIDVPVPAVYGSSADEN